MAIDKRLGWRQIYQSGCSRSPPTYCCLILEVDSGTPVSFDSCVEQPCPSLENFGQVIAPMATYSSSVDGCDDCEIEKSSNLGGNSISIQESDSLDDLIHGEETETTSGFSMAVIKLKGISLVVNTGKGGSKNDNPEFYMNVIEKLSPLMDTLSNKVGHTKKSGFVLLASCRKGSLILQSFLSVVDQKITSRIFQGFIGSFLELMMAEYGQFVFRRLVDSCNERQMHKIVHEIISQDCTRVTDASCRPCGSDSIRYLLKKASPFLLATLTAALAPGFCKLMMHQTGQYVFQLCLLLQQQQGHVGADNDLLHQAPAILEHCIDLATHQVGYLNLIRCIDAIKQGTQINGLLALISHHSVLLSQHPSGYYVLLHVLNLHNLAINDMICIQLQGHYIPLSLQKNGSFLVETFLKTSSHVGMNCVVNELIASHKLVHLGRHHFGKFVIKTALKITGGTNSHLHSRLGQALKLHLQGTPNLKAPPNILQGSSVN